MPAKLFKRKPGLHFWLTSKLPLTSIHALYEKEKENQILFGKTVSWHIFQIHLASQVLLCLTDMSTETLHQLPTKKVRQS